MFLYSPSGAVETAGSSQNPFSFFCQIVALKILIQKKTCNECSSPSCQMTPCSQWDVSRNRATNSWVMGLMVASVMVITLGCQLDRVQNQWGGRGDKPLVMPVRLSRLS